jgi:hypothetical protein
MFQAKNMNFQKYFPEVNCEWEANGKNQRMIPAARQAKAKLQISNLKFEIFSSLVRASEYVSEIAGSKEVRKWILHRARFRARSFSPLASM